MFQIKMVLSTESAKIRGIVILADYFIKFDTLHNCRLLADYSKSTVKSMIYKTVFIEWE